MMTNKADLLSFSHIVFIKLYKKDVSLRCIKLLLYLSPLLLSLKNLSVLLTTIYWFQCHHAKPQQKSFYCNVLHDFIKSLDTASETLNIIPFSAVMKDLP